MDESEHALAVIGQRCGAEIADLVVPVSMLEAVLVIAEELEGRVTALQARQSELDEVEAPVPV